MAISKYFLDKFSDQFIRYNQQYLDIRDVLNPEDAMHISLSIGELQELSRLARLLPKEEVVSSLDWHKDNIESWREEL